LGARSWIARAISVGMSRATEAGTVGADRAFNPVQHALLEAVRVNEVARDLEDAAVRCMRIVASGDQSVHLL
jgi:hypothetical protein